MSENGPMLLICKTNHEGQTSREWNVRKIRICPDGFYNYLIISLFVGIEPRGCAFRCEKQRFSMKKAVLFGEKSTASSMCRVYVVKIIRNSAIGKTC